MIQFLLLVVLCACSRQAFADSPFVDQVNIPEKKERRLEFAAGVRVVLRTDLAVVIRGEMLSLTPNLAVIVPDRSRFRNPEGVEYKFASLQSLNIPEVELKWAKGEDVEQFMTKLSGTEGLSFSNLDAFLASAPKPASENSETSEAMPANSDPGSPTVMNGEKRIITMQPAKTQPIIKPTITIICGNCTKEVALSSDSGQECPHCGILWDSSPLDAAELADLKAREEAAMKAAMQPSGFDSSEGSGDLAMNNEPMGNFEGQPAHNAAAPAVAQAPQPMTPPPPIQLQSQPQEITLENLPLWVKFTIFGVCLGVLYYSFFYLR